MGPDSEEEQDARGPQAHERSDATEPQADERSDATEPQTGGHGGPTEPDHHGRGDATGADVAVAADTLEDAVGALRDIDLDGLDDPAMRALLTRVQGAADRLGAFRLRVAGAIEARAVRTAGPGRESRAVRETREFFTDALRMSPSEAKDAGQTGRRLREAQGVQAALDDGRIRVGHATVITDATRRLAPEIAADIEARLIEAAADQHPVQLGRTARRLVAAADQEAAEESHQRAHARRFARVAQLPDGSLQIQARLAPGLQAETFQTWLAAHRIPDAHGEHRSPEQATADALVTGARAGLDAGTAPTDRGHAPHLLVLVSLDQLASDTGVGHGTWTGPIPMSEVRRLARNAQLSRVVVDARSVPLEVSEGRRPPNSGLWKALLVRDGGCRWPGCTAPPAWCDVAHGAIPDRDGGRLTLDNALLLCRRHHRRLDNGRWTINIRGPDITFQPPDSRPEIAAGPPHQR